MTAEWEVSPVFVLRHAGFPFDWLEELGVGEAVEQAADAVLAAEAEVLAAAGERHAPAVTRQLELGKLARTPKGAGAGFALAVEAWQAALAVFTARWTAERARIRAQLRRRALDPLVQEAVFLSSPATFDNVWRRYLARDPERDDADARRGERTVYTYLQRLCAKNETTSFFGPMGYGERAADPDAGFEVFHRGPVRRRTFFAFWAVTALARTIARDRELAVDIPLARNPLFEFGEQRARCPALGLDVPVDPVAARLLDALQTTSSIRGLAAATTLRVQEVFAALLPLLKSTALIHGLGFDAHSLSTFESVREALVRLPPGGARARWERELADLDALKMRFQEGGLDVRRSTLSELEQRFEALTGQPARRGEGQIYSDRLILYEEAASSFGIRVGDRFIDALAERLSGALQLSAAYGDQVQAAHRAAVSGQLRQLPLPIDLLTYLARLRPEEVSRSRFSPVPPVTVPGGEGRTLQLPADLCGASSAGGRYALPDVCLRATGVEPKRWGVVLSRVHHHLLVYGWLATWHPDRAVFERAARDWLAAEPSARGLRSLAVRRRNKGFYAFPGRRLRTAVADAIDLATDGLDPRELWVSNEENTPRLRDREGAPASLYLPLDDFSGYPPFAALAHPQVLHAPIVAEGDHVPRVEVGGTVYQRERWSHRFGQQASLPTPQLYLAVHRERRRRGWPRFVYARSERERKPFLIDTRSPLGIELLRHFGREDEPLTFVEMLPAPEELWLRDERGRYTCELRMQAVRWSEGHRPDHAGKDD